MLLLEVSTLPLHCIPAVANRATRFGVHRSVETGHYPADGGVDLLIHSSCPELVSPSARLPIACAGAPYQTCRIRRGVAASAGEF